MPSFAAYIQSAIGAVMGGLLMLVTFGPLPAAGQSVSSAEAAPRSILEDPYVRTEGKKGLDLLYDMKFEQANQIFDEIVERYPNHPIGPFLRGLNIWWNHIMLDLTDPSHDEEFFAAMEEVVERCDRMLDRDSDTLDALFLKGAALGFQARLHSNREEWFSAVVAGKKAIGYVREAGKKADGIPDYLFGKGMYDYYAAIIPEHYTMGRAVMLFLPDGDRERGLEQLRRAAQEGHFIQTEAVYFLLQIHYLYEENYQKSRQHARWLREQYPDNSYFHTYEGRVYARWGRWSRAQSVFAEVMGRYEAQQTGYNDFMAEQALYYLARERMIRDAHEEALRYLVQLEALTAREEHNTPYKTLGRLRQGMVYDALGRRDAAVRRYREVLQMNDQSGSHERAERYLETPYEE